MPPARPSPSTKVRMPRRSGPEGASREGIRRVRLCATFTHVRPRAQHRSRQLRKCSSGFWGAATPAATSWRICRPKGYRSPATFSIIRSPMLSVVSARVDSHAPEDGASRCGDDRSRTRPSACRQGVSSRGDRSAADGGHGGQRGSQRQGFGGYCRRRRQSFDLGRSARAWRAATNTAR